MNSGTAITRHCNLRPLPQKVMNGFVWERWYTKEVGLITWSMQFYENGALLMTREVTVSTKQISDTRLGRVAVAATLRVSLQKLRFFTRGDGRSSLARSLRSR